jgi:hypothetical protein
MFECPYCQHRHINKNGEKAIINCRNYGSQRFYFRCPNSDCQKVFSVYYTRKVIEGKTEETNQENWTTWGD